MKEVNIDNIVENNSYISPEIIFELLYKKLNKSYLDIKKSVDGSKIIITDELIKKYLEYKLKTEEKSNKSNVKSEDYEYDDFHRNYYVNYISFLRKRLDSFFELIDTLVTRNKILSKNMVKKYDIVIDENGNISREDVKRIIESFTYNYRELEEKVALGNCLDNYYKYPIDTSYKNYITENELYPDEEILETTSRNNKISDNHKVKKRNLKYRNSFNRSKKYTNR